MLRKAAAELRGPALPEPARHIWIAFQQIASSRSYTGAGMAVFPSAISSSEISAWCRLEGLRLNAFERHCIRALDQAFLKAYFERARQKQKGQAPRRKGG